ncbi:MAG: hypothetical protein AVDCRST_MAG31-2733, partial [uncultured Sphingomonas sp.]
AGTCPHQAAAHRRARRHRRPLTHRQDRHYQPRPRGSADPGRRQRMLGDGAPLLPPPHPGRGPQGRRTRPLRRGPPPHQGTGGGVDFL